MQDSLFFLAEQIVFCLFIPIGISLIVQSKLWVKLVQFLYSQNEQTFKIICLVSSFIYLPFGLFLVLTHNDWNMSPSVIVTIIGWVILVKCLILMIYPQLALLAKAIYGKSESFLKKYLMVCGLLYIIMGLLVFSNFWIY